MADFIEGSCLSPVPTARTPPLPGRFRLDIRQEEADKVAELDGTERRITALHTAACG
ncbi:hypothetical protein [Streptomyces sp. NPDC058385]|uniref:hypothetical protein n=1 Tax=Streptomyces sp. NPDC058385 TaxID=3346473 RepID=UPI00364D171C